MSIMSLERVDLPTKSVSQELEQVASGLDWDSKIDNHHLFTIIIIYLDLFKAFFSINFDFMLCKLEKKMV